MPREVVRIGLLGLGTVGSGVADILASNREDIIRRCGRAIEVSRILVRDREKKRKQNIDRDLLTDSYRDIVEDESIEIVVELIGGREPARTYILEALKRGKHVVTANKEVMARFGQELLGQARDAGVGISFEASVAGGIPIINNLKMALVANRIEKLLGIINGTTNYILTAMEEKGYTFEQALLEAQKKGYAESDPADDIEGRDAACKLAILASIAFESRVDLQDIYVEGIETIEKKDIEYAKNFGYRIKLIAAAREREGRVDVRVHPVFLPLEHPLSAVKDENNAILVRGNAVGEVMVYGAGAGALPTGSAVVADIMNMVRDMGYARVVGTPCTCSREMEIFPAGQRRGRYYLRIGVRDRPGMIARISRVFGDNQISLASILQMEEETEIVDVVFITHRTVEQVMQDTIAAIRNIDGVDGVRSMFRLEEEGYSR